MFYAMYFIHTFVNEVTKKKKKGFTPSAKQADILDKHFFNIKCLISKLEFLKALLLLKPFALTK